MLSVIIFPSSFQDIKNRFFPVVDIKVNLTIELYIVDPRTNYKMVWDRIHPSSQTSAVRSEIFLSISLTCDAR